MHRGEINWSRRGFVLITVLVIVGSALLVATGLLFLAQSQAVAASGAADTAETRALAWSGVQAVMSRLNDQRERILAGRLPELEPQYTIYETPTRVGIVRLAPGQGEGGELFSPEAGKLDINSADAEALVRTGMIDRPTAEAIVAYRDQTLGRPFQSIIELLNLPGPELVTAEQLYGPLDDLSAMPGESASQDRRSAAPVLGLADVLTVFSVEPAIQRNQRLRINLNTPWSDELGGRIEERFGADAANVVKQIFENGATFEHEAKIFQTLRFFKSPPENWPDIVDTFTTDEGKFHYGRLDLNTAPYAALLGLPGITPEQAAQIVTVRDELSDAERSTIAWLATAQIVPPEAYDQLAGRITTRCWTYRVRLLAGEVPADEPEAAFGPNALMYEVVIDLSGVKPRLAYLRDITLLGDTVRMAQVQALAATAEDDERDFIEEEEESPRREQTQPASAPSEKPREAVGRAESTPEPAASAPASQPAGSPREPGRIGRWLSSPKRDAAVPGGSAGGTAFRDGVSEG